MGLYESLRIMLHKREKLRKRKRKIRRGRRGRRGGSGGSVGLDLTNDVEPHRRQRPVTPRIVGQASHHHHAQCEIFN